MKNFTFKIAILFCLFCLPLCGYSQYAYSTVEQVTTPLITPGTVNCPVVRLLVVVGTTPIQCDSIVFFTTGTNNLYDIQNAKLWYSDSSTTFTLYQVSSTIVAPYVRLSFFPAANFYLNPGSNYFWLTYDIKPSAPACDTIDGASYFVYPIGMAPQVPIITNPAGYGLIAPCATGINDINVDNTATIFPNPITDKLNITVNNNALAEVTLSDIASRKILQQHFTKAITLNTSSLAKGLYFYEIRNNKGVIKQGKLVKQ